MSVYMLLYFLNLEGAGGKLAELEPKISKNLRKTDFLLDFPV